MSTPSAAGRCDRGARTVITATESPYDFRLGNGVKHRIVNTRHGKVPADAD